MEHIFEELPAGYRLVITGHSLGGGMTKVLTLLFRMMPLKYFGDLKKDQFLNKEVVGYAFAPPPVFRSGPGDSEETLRIPNVMQPNFVNIVNEFDMVPRLNYGSLKDFADIIDHINNDISVQTIERALNLCIIYLKGQEPQKHRTDLQRLGLFEEEGDGCSAN